MKIFLTVAPWSQEEMRPKSTGKPAGIKKLIGIAGGNSEPLGLLYLSSYLKKEDHVVSFMDGALHTQEEIVNSINQNSPEVVGISCISHTWENTKQLVFQIKKQNPRIKIVIGGPHVNSWGQEVLSNCLDIDYAIFGEGEIPFSQFLKHLEENQPLNEVKSFIWRKDGKIIENSPSEPIENLDQIPFPDYDLINHRDYRPSIGFYKALPSGNIITSRGCPYQCTFCVSHPKLTLRSPKNVLDEIELLINKYKIKHLTFYDESLTIIKERAINIFEGMIKRKLKIPWCANARVNQIDRELLLKMKQAGCWRLLYGIESGVQKNLDILKKGISLEQVREAIHLSKEARIETFGTFMFGIPNETYLEGLKTIEFALSLPLDYAAFLNLVPYKNTEIYKDIDKHGKLTGKWSTNLISFIPYSTSEEEMIKLNDLANRKFYLRPTYILKRLAKTKTLEEFKINLRGFFSYSFFHYSH